MALEHNEIHGAHGDGVASWNDCKLRVEHCSIHSNAGFGVLINTDADFARLSNNTLWDNAEGATIFRGQQASKRGTDSR